MNMINIDYMRHRLLISLALILVAFFATSCSDEKDETSPTISGLLFNEYNATTGMCYYSLDAYDSGTAIKSIQIFKDDSVLYNSETKERSRVERSEKVYASCRYTPNGYKIIAIVQDFDGNTTRDTLVSPVISAVSYPQSGASLQAGTSQTITWSSNNFSGQVRIELYKSTKLYQVIATNVSNTGKYSWTVPTSFYAGTDYKIKVSCVLLSAASCYSNQFAIAPYITPSYPSANINKISGDTLSIRWSDNVVENLKIDLYKGGSLYSNIASSVSASSYIWTIPSTLKTGSDYKIRLTSLSNSAVYSETANIIFAAPYIDFSSPSSGASWQMGTTQIITWKSNIPNNVKIELYKSSTLVQTISSSASSSGSYSWFIPINLSTGTDYKIRITSAQNSAVYAETLSFTILPSVYYQNQTIYAGGQAYFMISVPNGTFTMGSTNSSDVSALPVHSVTLSSYYIGQMEVTQALWKAVMGTNPSYFTSDNRPVERVSWNDCQTFITKLNQLTGQTFRLPTEAEWEFAAKGGHKSLGYTYSGSNLINNVAWYSSNTSSTTYPVGTKAANELGLYDMSGNVWEWCSDRYGNYTSSAQTNPSGSISGSYYVMRGGGWQFTAESCRVDNRYYGSPNYSSYYLGFRFVSSK